MNEPLPYHAIFVSCVSREYTALRARIDRDLALVGYRVLGQQDLHQAQAGSLLKLDALIQQSDAVVHVLGRDPGPFPSGAALAELLGEQGPRNLLHTHPNLRELIQDFSTISYAHWETLLALHHDKAIFVYEPTGGDQSVELSAADVAAQLDHRKRLTRAEPFIERCEDDFEASVWSVIATEARRSRTSWPRVT